MQDQQQNIQNLENQKTVKELVNDIRSFETKMQKISPAGFDQNEAIDNFAIIKKLQVCQNTTPPAKSELEK